MGGIEVVSIIFHDTLGVSDGDEKIEVGRLKHVVFAFANCRFGAPRRRGSGPPGIKGRVRLRLEESFYQNPYPECICKS